MSVLLSIVMLVFGFVLLIKGADFFVDGYASLSLRLPIPGIVIGLTIVALGTSLPELFTSTVAAFKGKSDIAIGNVVGSNIFNMFFTAGVSSVIRSLPFDKSLNFDFFILGSASVFLFLIMFIGKKRSLDRWEAILFLCFYTGYVLFLVL